MASKVEELTVAYEEDGVQILKELDKKVLSDGAWATVIYKYQHFDREKQSYGPEIYTIRRYKKRNGEYFQQSSGRKDY